jgi:hypothetical protein
VSEFFEEVEEQLRSDRYRTLARRAMPWVLGVLAAVLIGYFGYWGWDRYQDQAIDKASQQYADGLAAFDKGDVARARQAWGDAAKSPARGYRSLALMQLGGLDIAERKIDPAVALFDQAAEAAPDEVIGDLARLKAAFALMDAKPYKDLEARLTPLMGEDRPYRVQAREALAFAKLMNKDTAGARGDFVVISALLDAPEGARARARAAIDLIDSGSAKSVPEVARLAAILTPAAPPPGGNQPPVPMQPAPGQP